MRVCVYVFECVFFCVIFSRRQGKAQASALGAQPNALLTVWNLQDLQSKGPVRYGDVLFLQMGRHEVRGVWRKRRLDCSRFVAPPNQVRTVSPPAAVASLR